MKIFQFRIVYIKCTLKIDDFKYELFSSVIASTREDRFLTHSLKLWCKRCIFYNANYIENPA